MRLHSVKLNNYKSMREKEHNEIIIEPNITAIIGMNESGKSNILSGISKISFLVQPKDVFASTNLNRNCGDNDKISYTIVLKALPDEDKSLQQDTMVEIAEKSFAVTGGFLNYCRALIGHKLEKLQEIAKTNPFKFTGNDADLLRQRCAQINIEKSVNIPVVDAAIKSFSSWTNKIPADQREQYSNLINEVQILWEKVCGSLPTIFFRDEEKKLQSLYTGEAIKNSLQNTNSLLHDLVRYLGFTHEQLLEAVSGKTDGKTQDLQDRIQNSIEEKINKPFQKFYTPERITLKARFYANSLAFSVNSNNGSTMTLGERSNGLRWYLNLFIDVMANEVPSRQVIYLFDEPGISLHVNAQKELLRLFNHLANQGNQIVYTTHSPYMLNIDNHGIERIRATVKDGLGNTKIYKTAYDPQIACDSREDTLTPIVQALGMSLSDTFGPAFGKFNVVTEGVSDSIYLTAIGKILEVDLSQFAFIPVCGASTAINVCTILYGWNCSFMALFDYDDEGVEKGGEIFRAKYNYDYKEHFIYLKDVSMEEIEQKTYKTEKVEIEDLVNDFDAFLQTSGYGELSKTLKAKFYADALKDESHMCSKETLTAFRELFDRLLACKEKQNRDNCN